MKRKNSKTSFSTISSARDVDTFSGDGSCNDSRCNDKESAHDSALFSEVVPNEFHVAVSKLPTVLGSPSDAKPSKNQHSAVLHSIALAGYALKDVLHYADNTTVLSPGVLCLVLVLYGAAACWAVCSRHPRIAQNCSSRRLSVFLLSVMQIAAALLSYSWREEFKLDMRGSSDDQVAYSVALLQVLVAVCYPLDAINVGLVSVTSFLSVLAFRWAQAAPALTIVEDGLLVAFIGIACFFKVEPSEVVDRYEETPGGITQLFAPFHTHYENENDTEATQGTELRTNLDRLTLKIATVRKNIKASEAQSEWLEVFSCALKSILVELAQVGSLLTVDECELKMETPALREYFKKTFGAQAAGKHNPQYSLAESKPQSVDNPNAPSGMHVAGATDNVIGAKYESVEQAMSQMLGFLTSREPNASSSLQSMKSGHLQELVLKADGLGSWHFDIFNFSSLCDGHSLLVAGMEALKESAEKLHLDMSMITIFLDRVEARYDSSNSYHNSLHATDVMNSMMYFLKLQIGCLMNLSVIERFSGILASASHDVGHTGQANRYHANALTPLALLFNDQAIMESMHCAITFAILQTQECNFLARLDAESRATFRGLVVHMILDTDLGKHVQTVSRFRQEMLSDVSLKQNSLNPNQRQELLSFILKSADVGGSSKTFVYHIQWTMRINTEFFEQGDNEKKLGLPCSPFCDRAKTHVAESQRGFFKFIVMPLYDTLDEYLLNSRMRFEVLPERNRNFEFWGKYEGEDFDYTNPMDNVRILKRAFAVLIKAVKGDQIGAAAFESSSCDGTASQEMFSRPIVGPRRSSEPKIVGTSSLKQRP